jgi:hypothetical protein
LKHAAFFRGELRKRARRLRRVGDGFFDEKVFAALKQEFPDLEMSDGRCANRGGIHQTRKFLERGGRPGVVFFGHASGGFRIGVVNGREL